MLILDALAQSPAFFIATCLFFGLLVGSFLNVVIYRVPIMLERQWQQSLELAQSEAEQKKQSSQDAAATAKRPATEASRPERFNLIAPPSTCPSCKTPIKAYQNIPVLSYLLLNGRCAACGTRISVRYPIIEALTGLLSALVAWKFGFGWPAMAALVLTWFLVALTFIDVDHQLLPDNMTLPLLWIGLLLSLWAAEAGGAAMPVDPRSSIIGAVTGYVSLWSVFHLFRLLTGKEGMGYGDFKLFAALGAWLGWKMLLPIILMAALVGAVLGSIVLMIQGKGRQTPIPFGPFLAAAGWIMLMFGPEIVARYMGYMGMSAPPV